MTEKTEQIVPFEFSSPHPKTWIFDLDGTILEYNNLFRGEQDQLLTGVKELWDEIKDDFIILTTARPGHLREVTEQYLNENGIKYNHIIFDLPRGERILVNDSKPDVETTAYAWVVGRNKGFNG